MKISIGDFGERVRANMSRKRYCFAWLFYPSVAGDAQHKYDYLYGSIVNCHILRDFFGSANGPAVCQVKADDVDFCVITPDRLGEDLDNMIALHFGVHVAYSRPVWAHFLEQSEREWSADERARWSGVMNKLYLWHPDLFGGYEKIVYLDSDMLITDVVRYARLLVDYETPAGVYEQSNICKHNSKKGQLLVKAFKQNQIIPAKCCTAGTLFYHCVNASLYVLRATEEDYEKMRTEMSSHSVLVRRHPQLARHVLYFPEQEYLTNFFAGRWHAVDRKMLGTTTTSCQIAGRFWENVDFDRRTGVPDLCRVLFVTKGGTSRKSEQEFDREA